MNDREGRNWDRAAVTCSLRLFCRERDRQYNLDHKRIAWKNINQQKCEPVVQIYGNYYISTQSGRSLFIYRNTLDLKSNCIKRSCIFFSHNQNCVVGLCGVPTQYLSYSAEGWILRWVTVKVYIMWKLVVVRNTSVWVGTAGPFSGPFTTWVAGLALPPVETGRTARGFRGPILTRGPKRDISQNWDKSITDVKNREQSY